MLFIFAICQMASLLNSDLVRLDLTAGRLFWTLAFLLLASAFDRRDVGNSGSGNTGSAANSSKTSICRHQYF